MLSARWNIRDPVRMMGPIWAYVGPKGLCTNPTSVEVPYNSIRLLSLKHLASGPKNSLSPLLERYWLWSLKHLASDPYGILPLVLKSACLRSSKHLASGP